MGDITSPPASKAPFLPTHRAGTSRRPALLRFVFGYGLTYLVSAVLSTHLTRFLEWKTMAWSHVQKNQQKNKNAFLDPLPLCRALRDIRQVPSGTLAVTHVSLWVKG